MTPEQFVRLVARLASTDEAPLTDDDIVETLDSLIATARRIATADLEVAA